MIYKQFQDLQLSTLGLGCMRLPVINHDDSNIDVDLVKEMVQYAFAHGVNYFDTAYGYHGGNSEKVLGEALKQLPRERFYLATKFPGYDLSNMTRVKEIFEEQLKKLDVSYFDFYLFHNVYEKNVDYYLDPKYGIYDYLMEQKKMGRIRHLGFSCHGSMEVLKKFLEAYGEAMEFCQLQINYVDWEFQDAKDKVALLKEYQIPVWVMEPVRGGKLSQLPENETALLKEMRKDETPTQWAFRFLQSIPEVVVTLSGCSDQSQLMENIETFSDNKPASSHEREVLLAMAKRMLAQQTVACTACKYCISHCPKELNIPYLLSQYNQLMFTGVGKDFIAPMSIDALDQDKKPSACVACHACEKVCPQQLPIPDALADFSKKLGLLK